MTIKASYKKDSEFVEVLQSLGVNRNAAKLITYLKDAEEGSPKDIEMATGMRQPEVSIAMGTLRGLGCLSEHEVKNLGKGRLRRSMLCVRPLRRS